jgi:hypothetical protein
MLNISMDLYGMDKSRNPIHYHQQALITGAAGTVVVQCTPLGHQHWRCPRVPSRTIPTGFRGLMICWDGCDITVGYAWGFQKKGPTLEIINILRSNDQHGVCA